MVEIEVDWGKLSNKLRKFEVNWGKVRESEVKWVRYWGNWGRNWGSDKQNNNMITWWHDNNVITKYSMITRCDNKMLKMTTQHVTVQSVW